MDSRVPQGLFLFMDSYLTVDLYWGTKRLVSSPVSPYWYWYLVPAFFFSFFSFLYGTYPFPLAVFYPEIVTAEKVTKWEQGIILTIVLAVLRRFLICSKHHINIC